MPDLERGAAVPDRRRVLPDHDGALARCLDGVGVAVGPLQRPHPPIAITSIRPDSRGPHVASPWLDRDLGDLRGCVRRPRPDPELLEGRRSAGLSVDPSGWRVARSVFVADDETTACRYAHREDGAHGFYFHVMRTKLAKAGALDVMRDFPGQPDSELSTKRCLERLVIAGTPAERRGPDSRIPRRGRRRSAPCSILVTTGPIQRSPGAPWSSWRTRSGPGSIEPRMERHRMSKLAGRYVLTDGWPNHCVQPTPVSERG